VRRSRSSRSPLARGDDDGAASTSTSTSPRLRTPSDVAAFVGDDAGDMTDGDGRGRRGSPRGRNGTPLAAARSIERSTCATTTGRLLGGSATYARTPIESIDASVAV
jgi:hypothetical protein